MNRRCGYNFSMRTMFFEWPSPPPALPKRSGLSRGSDQTLPPIVSSARDCSGICFVFPGPCLWSRFLNFCRGGMTEPGPHSPERQNCTREIGQTLPPNDSERSALYEGMFKPSPSKVPSAQDCKREWSQPPPIRPQALMTVREDFLVSLLFNILERGAQGT